MKLSMPCLMKNILLSLQPKEQPHHLSCFYYKFYNVQERINLGQTGNTIPA